MFSPRRRVVQSPPRCASERGSLPEGPGPLDPCSWSAPSCSRELAQSRPAPQLKSGARATFARARDPGVLGPAPESEVGFCPAVNAPRALLASMRTRSDTGTCRDDCILECHGGREFLVAQRSIFHLAFDRSGKPHRKPRDVAVLVGSRRTRGSSLGASPSSGDSELQIVRKLSGCSRGRGG
jgi:hypothetical protein